MYPRLNLANAEMARTKMLQPLAKETDRRAFRNLDADEMSWNKSQVPYSKTIDTAALNALQAHINGACITSEGLDYRGIGRNIELSLTSCA